MELQPYDEIRRQCFGSKKQVEMPASVAVRYRMIGKSVSHGLLLWSRCLRPTTNRVAFSQPQPTSRAPATHHQPKRRSHKHIYILFLRRNVFSNICPTLFTVKIHICYPRPFQRLLTSLATRLPKANLEYIVYSRGAGLSSIGSGLQL